MSAVPALRPDIQALRGYAVGVVILYHAGLGLAPGGFLGVDLFFVVSGFLIGGHVLRALDGGTFSFREFYLRRIRRLAPAAYAVLLACVIAGALLLTPEAHARFTQQALGALAYATNVVLWRQINYFNNAAASEPLLHMWSLGIEEQFYLLLPLALWLLPRRVRWPVLALVTLGSLAGYLALYPRSPGVAFYLLPTRAWELGLGVIAALLADRPEVRGLAARLAWPAVMLVLVPVLIALPVPQHVLAIPACLGTMVLILAELPGRSWLTPLVRIGDASYALYLVHWPLFAFAHVLLLGAPLPVPTALALVALSGVLGWLLHRWIELPGRFAPLAPRRVLLLYPALTLLLAGAALGGAALVRERGPGIDLSGVTGLDLPGCDAAATRFDGRCATSPAPQVLVWGDSFSQQLIPALTATGPAALVQASKGQCAPLLGLAPVDRDATQDFARGCLQFNASVIEYLRRSPSVRVVVLSGYYQRYAQPGTMALHADGSLRPADLSELIAAQRATANALRALGKRVVLVTGPVQAGFDPGQCWARRGLGLPSLAPAADCAITAPGAAPTAAWSEVLFTRFAAEADLPVLRLDRLLCPDPARCETRRGGSALYRDANHLGLDGSRLIGREFGLFQQVEAKAR